MEAWTLKLQLATLAVFLAVVLTPPAWGVHWCDNAPDVEIPNTLYVVIDETILDELTDPEYHGYVFSIWVYQECNGIPGLQRGGTSLLGDADLCQTSALPDSCMIF